MSGQHGTRGARRGVLVLLASSALAFALPARAQPGARPADRLGRTPAPIFPGAAPLRAALAAATRDTLLVRMAPPPENQVLVAQRVRATAETLRRLLLDPEAYRRAIPALIEATSDNAPRDAPSPNNAREITWELEVPGFNFKGRLWLKDFGELIQLRLSQGAFAPGTFSWRILPGGEETVLVLEATANVRDASWITRTLVERERLAEPAITVTAAIVLIRALTLLATPGGTSTRNPITAMAPPALARLDGSVLLAVARALGQEQNVLGPQIPVGLVHTAPGGRLSHAQIGLSVPVPLAEVADGLATASNWTALPGFRRVIPGPAMPATASEPMLRAAPLKTGARQYWAVRSNFPFVSFDGLWDVTRGRSLRAENQDGRARGALWSWEVHSLDPSGAQAHNSFAILSLYPRLDRIGFLPRKFIEREPLLEHALSLALAYVNAVTLLRRVASERLSWPRMQERQAMVAAQIAARGIRDPDVLRALERVPRHLFVPEASEHAAYQDRPLPIGFSQTISQPYIVGLMTELSGARRGARVLEIGTGSGYQAAILSALGAEVYSIEIVEPLAAFARERLARLDLPDVGAIHLRVGDGYAGWPEAAPFDAIIVTAAPPRIPEPLKTQLKVGGKLVIPVGPDGDQQVLQVVTRTGDGYQTDTILPVRFVPMTGKAQE